MTGLGTPVPDWVPPPRPDTAPMCGRFVRLERLASVHVADLFRYNSEDDVIWHYLPYGPFASEEAYGEWLSEMAGQVDPVFWAIRDLERDAWTGVASYLRIAPKAGSIEVGHINFSRALQRTRAATEAMYLMMAWAFDAGYRRYEWKCNALNLSSRRAAERLGFSYEGVFRQAAVIKGYNRDTAWFAAIDTEWPSLRSAFEAWLAPENFDGEGRQKTSLADLTAPIRVARDPAL